MNKILEKATANPKAVAMLIAVLIFGILITCAAAYHTWQKNTDAESRLQQATVLSQQDAQDKNVLQNKLEMSNQNAEMLAKFVAQAQAGQVQPINHFTVQAPSVQVAAQQVADRINAKDPTLPPQALEQTDNTIVTTHKLTDKQKEEASKENEKRAADRKQPINTEYGVDVYKNNNYRNWEWSVGYGVQDGSKYVPIGLQRNYSKDKAISAEVHIDPSMPKNIIGWEVKQVWKTDKLFLLF